jgi:MFS family permease
VAAPYFFLPSYAISIGCTPIQGALAVGIMSVVNVVGKIILGHLADRFGRINMFLVTTFLTAVSCIAVWPFATTYGWLLVFAVLFGITSGASYSLFMNLSMACGDKEDSPETMSIIFSASIFGDLFGAIIFAALLNASGNAYLPSQAFCAASYGLGTLCILRLRLLKSRKLYDRI